MKKDPTEDAFSDLISIFAKTTDQQDMRRLFNEIFTPAEAKDIALRWNLMRDLYKGIPQRTIARTYHISLCKITRGSKILKDRNSLCRKILSDRFDDNLHI